MIQRSAHETVLRLAKGFPVICISGPRQSGKTTLARSTFPDKPYLSLEDPDIKLLAKEDPRGLLEQYADGVILDEAQEVPEIFTYLKTIVDEDPKPGKFIVTGSSQYNLLSGVAESLAGRAAFVTLLPFSYQELVAAGRAKDDLYTTLLKGLYPPLYSRDLTPYDWYTAYISSYLERDVRSVLAVKDLSIFQTFLKMTASRVGQLINLSALAQDCGITHNTAKAWLSVLQSSGIIYLLPPYFKNFGKRLVKTPKLYFLDPGLLCRLLQITDQEQLFLHPNRGNIFESFVVSEMLKRRFNEGSPADLYFWRDNVGTEVDIVYEEGTFLKACESKSGKTFSPDFTATLQTWMTFSRAKPEDCSVIYGGDLSFSYKGVQVRTWKGIS